MDRWLARVQADHRKVPLARKIIQDKPDTVAPAAPTDTVRELPSAACDQTVTSYGTPRQGADGPLAEDVMKCQLKPMRRDDYPVTLHGRAVGSGSSRGSPAVSATTAKPGVTSAARSAWLTYQDKRGRVIYGGKPMGRPPVSHRVR